MTYQDIITNARTCIGPYCKACPVCNGKACGAQMPGPGAKGVGDTAIRNYDAWKRIRINMDTISENVTLRLCDILTQYMSGIRNGEIAHIPGSRIVFHLI